jgi:hypothetical protein
MVTEFVLKGNNKILFEMHQQSRYSKLEECSALLTKRLGEMMFLCLNGIILKIRPI